LLPISYIIFLTTWWLLYLGQKAHACLVRCQLFLPRFCWVGGGKRKARGRGKFLPVCFLLRHVLSWSWSFISPCRFCSQTTDNESWTGPLSYFASTSAWFVTGNHQK
jgi:hypothetical protein